MNKIFIKDNDLILFVIEYPAFFIGWLSTLLYQLGTSVAVIHWSRFVVHFINQISDYNITSSIVGAPVAWSEESNTFYRTGQVINIPAIAITIAITVVLLIGIRETAIFNLILVVFKVGVLLLFIFACCGYVDCKNYEPFFPSNQGIRP
jgi:APA family basic amino acid/polyamine antiporter